MLTESIPYVRSVAIGVWVDVGSRDEEDGSDGISHFLEHIVFKGTKHRDAADIARTLESVGGTLNAFTGREQTCFHAQVLDEHLDVALDLLWDLLANPKLDQRDIGREKRVVLEEIREVKDSPAEYVHDVLASACWFEHPLGRSILGTGTNVKKMSREKLIRFMRDSYQPHNIVVAASGNVDHDRLVDLVLSRDWPKQAPGRKRRRKRPPPRFGYKLKFQRQNTSQTHVGLAFPAFPFVDERRTTLAVLNILLGSGMSSRLFQRIREQLGLVYNIYSFVDFYRDVGLLGIYFATNAKQFLHATSEVLTAIDILLDKGVSDEELARSKNQLKGYLMLSLESTGNRMNRLAKHELMLGRFVDLDESLERIDAVTVDDLSALSRELFGPARFSAAVLGPNHRSEIRRFLRG